MSKPQATTQETSNVVQINPDFHSFKFFMDWSSKLQFTDGFAELHNMVLDAVQRKTPYKHSWVMVTDPENSDETYLISISSQNKESILESYPRLNMNSDPMLREIKQSHIPVIVEDARTDPRTNKEIVNSLGNVTIINVPIVLTGNLVGMLGAGSFGDEGSIPPTQEDIDFLILLSNYVGPVIVRILEQEKQLRYQEALEKAKQEAELNHQLKTEFIENVTHELRTPLHAINGFVQLLELESENFSSEQVSYLSDINKANTRLLSLVENVLDFESANTGNLSLQNATVNLVELIRSSESDFNDKIKAKKISLTSNLDDCENLTINTDKKRLKQIFDNLLNNAIEYNRPNGSIHISIESEHGDILTIAVKDSGIGIPKTKTDILFSPFARINKNADTLGAGISLVVSKQLTELLGGELKFTTEENAGSIFWLEFPFQPSI